MFNTCPCIRICYGHKGSREELGVEFEFPCYTAWETFPQKNKNRRDIGDRELTISGQDLQNRWCLHDGLLPIVDDAEMLQSLTRWWHPFLELKRIAQPQRLFLLTNRLALQFGLNLDSEPSNTSFREKILCRFLPALRHRLFLILWSTVNVEHRPDVLSSLVQTLAQASGSYNVSKVRYMKQDRICDVCYDLESRHTTIHSTSSVMELSSHLLVFISMALKQSRASTEGYLLRLKPFFYLNFWRIHLWRMIRQGPLRDDVSFHLFLLYGTNKDTEQFCEKYSLVSTDLLFLKNKLLSSI